MTVKMQWYSIETQYKANVKKSETILIPIIYCVMKYRLYQYNDLTDD